MLEIVFSTGVGCLKTNLVFKNKFGVQNQRYGVYFRRTVFKNKFGVQNQRYGVYFRRTVFKNKCAQKGSCNIADAKHNLDQERTTLLAIALDSLERGYLIHYLSQAAFTRFLICKQFILIKRNIFV